MPTDPTNMNSPTLTGGNTNASYVNITSGAYPNIEHLILDGKDWVVVSNTLGVEIYELNPTTLQFVDGNATTAGVQPTFSYSDRRQAFAAWKPSASPMTCNSSPPATAAV